MKIVFCSSEITPYAKTGGMADVCYALPLALENLGCEICLVMPKYAGIDESAYPLEKVNDRTYRLTTGKQIDVYFVANDWLFNRGGIYSDGHGDFGDNLQRFQYLCIRALEMLKEINLRPDIIHCNDWQTALIPVYLKHRFARDEFFANTHTVFTIHNLAYQGVFPKIQFQHLGLDRNLFNPGLLEFYDQINLLKAGIVACEKLTTVSPRYAQEIQSPQMGWRLDGILRSRQSDIVGILNGIDYNTWDPQKDPHLKVPYSSEQIELKQENKRYLQEISRLAVNPDIPVFGFVGRLASQKGIDLIASGIEEMMRRDLQIVFLGQGERRYSEFLRNMSSRYPQKIAAFIEFNERLAHQIYAGSDMLLMPSQYEPCGLNQMISLKYGTVPLVHHTGGLADTIVPHSEDGNGFVFRNYNSAEFLGAVGTALAIYHDKPKFTALLKKGLSCNFGWDASARKYLEVYTRLKERRSA